MLVAPFSLISTKLACLRSLDFLVRKRVGARTGVGERGLSCVNIHELCCSRYRSMATSSLTKEIDALVKNLDRPQLLAILGVEDRAGQVGDNECTRPIAASSIDRFPVHKDDVPFLEKVGSNCCAGAIVRRYGKNSVGIPCFSQDVESNGKFCAVCNEIWTEHDTNGFYILDPEVMPFASKFYKPARSAVLWNLPFMKDMSGFFSEQIQVVKDVVEGTDSELERDWPYCSFKEISTEILINSGVLHHDATRSKNPYKRDQWECDRLAIYMQNMIQCWLQISAVVDTDDLARDMKLLQKKAKAVGLASMWAVQHENPVTPVWVGPLVPADVMLAGFRTGAKMYKTLVHNMNVASEDEMVDFGDFSWGSAVDRMDEWAKSVLMATRPPLKSKKYVASSQTPPRPPKSKSKSPSNVRRWYAAKGTARPGAYIHKHVADSYNIDGKGTVKMFRSLAKLRAWMDIPAPRMFFENECNPAPLPDAQEQTQDEVSDEIGEEYFAIKGGGEAGIFTDMSEMMKAMERSGGEFAMFASRKEAEVYVRPEEAFVVWAGRQIGIMTKSQCVKATQRLKEAKMCGPLTQKAAAEKWKKVKGQARVVSGARAPTTPAKSRKKNKQTPKKKKYYYAVAKGKVPGVYDSWDEAEQQVKGVKPNLYAKFKSKQKAQEFVDDNSGATDNEEEEEEGEEAGDDDTEDQKDQGKAALEIEIPSVQKLQEAEDEGQVRVFACHTGIGKARVAMTFDDAIRGVKNASVQVINSKSTLLDNLAEAEVRLRKDKINVRKSLQDRLAEARARAGAESHAKKSTTAAATTTPKGESLGAFVGMSTVGRAKETRMITYNFLSQLKPIKLCYNQVPFGHELDEDMDLPESKAAFNPATNMKDLTIKDFFNAKEKALPTWKLMGFQEFMSFCRKARRMCQSSSREGAAVNAAALDMLMDIGLRTYRILERMDELGPDSIRFKAKMYLHLQYMCMHRVLHASAIADTVFMDAVDPFIVRLPGQSKFRRYRYTTSPVSTPSPSGPTPRKPTFKTVPPLSGCYRCPATDHYANDTRFHPVLPDGTQEKVSDADKAAILKRVEKSDLSEAVKAAEKDKVRQYWAQHGL